MSTVTSHISSQMSSIFSNVFFRLSVFFVISIPAFLNNADNVYQVSGQAWFFGFGFGSYEIHLPGFSTDVFSIFDSVHSPLKLIYYIMTLGIIWSTSFLLASKVLNLFMNPIFSFLCASAFHINPYVISIFLSAPVWDFFPKIHFFFLIMLVLFRHTNFQDAHKNCSYRFDRVYSRTYFILFVGVLCSSIRYSTINIVFLYLILIAFSNKKLIYINLSGFLVKIILLCLFLYVILPGQLTSIKVYFASSIFHSNYSLIADLEKPLSISFKDPEILNYVEVNTFFQVFVDKLYFTDIFKIFKMYLEFMSSFSLINSLFPISNVFTYLAVIVLLIFFTIILSRGGSPTLNLYLLKLYFFIFSFTVFMAYLSRAQLNQDGYLLFLEYHVLFSIMNGFYQRLPLILKLERYNFAIKEN